MDQDIGRGTQDVGVGIVTAGAGVIVYTWWSGYGDAVGGGIMAAGGSVYASGTAVSEVGNLFKAFGGQEPGVTAANMLAIPTMRLGPIGQIVTDKALEYFTDKMQDPCSD